MIVEVLEFRIVLDIQCLVVVSTQSSHSSSACTLRIKEKSFNTDFNENMSLTEPIFVNWD